MSPEQAKSALVWTTDVFIWTFVVVGHVVASLIPCGFGPCG